MHCSDRIKETILARLISMLAKNPYASFFRNLENKEDLEDHVVQLVSSVSLDQRVFNMPTTSQVAAIWIEDNTCGQPTKRDILVYSHSGSSHIINYYYGCYDPLQHPLLFPYGDVGLHNGIQRKVSTGSHRNYNTEPILDPYLVSSTEDLLDNENEGKILKYKTYAISC
ncbi:hypothetical protein Scep_014853 [Stephania cephalantha]|uniref:Uncharacterized protein n=1 Tax=Stephania cephalantha TaxID=152367 RepID=A0AAP0NZT9_9MAGN